MQRGTTVVLAAHLVKRCSVMVVHMVAIRRSARDGGEAIHLSDAAVRQPCQLSTAVSAEHAVGVVGMA